MCTEPAGSTAVTARSAAGQLRLPVRGAGKRDRGPWHGQPDYYKVECKRQDGAHWLNLSKVGLEGDTRPDLGAVSLRDLNYHVPEVNLAEGNLLTIAQLQTDSYEARIAGLKARLER